MEIKYKLATKFQIIHIVKGKPDSAILDSQAIQPPHVGTIIGLLIIRPGIKMYDKDRMNKAKTALGKLSKFRCLSTKIQLHLYKAASRISSPIPLPTVKKINMQKLQGEQNNTPRRAAKHCPPYYQTILALPRPPEQHLNIRLLHQAARL